MSVSFSITTAKAERLSENDNKAESWFCEKQPVVYVSVRFFDSGPMLHSR